MWTLSQVCGSHSDTVSPCLQAGLSWWEVVSPFAGFGATSALIFVLAAAAVKAVIEDKKRQKEDHKTNNSSAVVMERGADGAPPPPVLLRSNHVISDTCKSATV